MGCRQPLKRLIAVFGNSVMAEQVGFTHTALCFWVTALRGDEVVLPSLGIVREELTSTSVRLTDSKVVRWRLGAGSSNPHGNEKDGEKGSKRSERNNKARPVRAAIGKKRNECGDQEQNGDPEKQRSY